MAKRTQPKNLMNKKLSANTALGIATDPKTGERVNVYSVNSTVPYRDDLTHEQNLTLADQALHDDRKGRRRRGQQLKRLEATADAYRKAVTAKTGKDTFDKLQRIRRSTRTASQTRGRSARAAKLKKIEKQQSALLQRSGVNASDLRKLSSTFARRADRILTPIATSPVNPALLSEHLCEGEKVNDWGIHRGGFFFGRTSRNTGGDGRVTDFTHFNVPDWGTVGHYQNYRHMDPDDFDAYAWDVESQVGEVQFARAGQRLCLLVELGAAVWTMKYAARNEPWAFSNGWLKFNANLIVDVSSQRFSQPIATLGAHKEYFNADDNEVDRGTISPAFGQGIPYKRGHTVFGHFESEPLPSDGNYIIWVGVEDWGGTFMNDFEVQKQELTSLWQVKRLQVFRH